jgi:hypothetical protein
MGVNVRDNTDTSLFADIPKRAEIATIEAHDTSVQAFHVQVVVENELSDPGPRTLAVSQQKRSTFSLAVVASLAEHR